MSSAPFCKPKRSLPRSNGFLKEVQGLLIKCPKLEIQVWDTVAALLSSIAHLEDMWRGDFRGATTRSTSCSVHVLVSNPWFNLAKRPLPEVARLPKLGPMNQLLPRMAHLRSLFKLPKRGAISCASLLFLGNSFRLQSSSHICLQILMILEDCIKPIRKGFFGTSKKKPTA